ncbi:uncharacterized protein N7503_007367 [Penicillium pulvis]|uniref:uncharacterized protein n=1 Tax=Penicillium pulvis TaxID=1562058 RepID=UPI00254705CE|nr:uncharacterized protein N7503_007367 [Penicillium pulvis]KAJ5798071.1 hypothetical protein N7503_007367 [Penicillium pulvis]
MDLKENLVPRTDTTCTGNKLWYVCTAGDYKGCCSSNPCTSGICPDDDTTTSSITKTTTTSKSSSTSSNDSTSTSSTEGATTATAEATSSASTMGSSSPGTIASTTSTSTSTAAPVTSSSSSHSAIIGGAIGGIVAFLFIAVILFFCWKRRQRMKNTEPLIIDHGQLPSSWRMGRARKYGNGKHKDPLLKEQVINIRHKGSTYPHFEPSITDYHENTVISALAGGLNVSRTSPSPAGDASCAETIPAIPTAELLAPIPKRPGHTPELPDTMARRMRAELPSDSQRDLINVPLNQRQGLMIYQRGGIANLLPRDSLELSSTSSSPNTTNSSPNTGSKSVAGLVPPFKSMSPRLVARNTARRVVTEEGVVMGANLDRYSGDPRVEDMERPIEEGNRVGNEIRNGNENSDADTKKGKENTWQSQDHVMSFMNFDGSLPLTDVSEAGCSYYEAEGPSPPISSPTSISASPPISSPIPNRIGNMTFIDMGPLSPTPSEVPPAYEAEEGIEFEVNGERKTPARTMGMGIRRFG